MATHLFTALAVAGLALPLAGCADSEQPAETTTVQPAPAMTETSLANEVCPIMGGAAKPSVTATWQGKTIGFCCEECIPEWNSLTDEQKEAKLLAAAAEAKSDSAGDAEHEHEMQHDGANEGHADHQS